MSDNKKSGTVRIVQYCIYIFVGIVALALAYGAGHDEGYDDGNRIGYDQGYGECRAGLRYFPPYD